jgi:protein TonB
LPDGTKIYSRRDGVSEPQKLYCPNPLYTKQASKDGLEGPVTLQIVVKPDGSVGNVRVLQGLGKGLDQSAAKTVSTWRFTPSMKNGKPVAVRVDVTINFILQH